MSYTNGNQTQTQSMNGLLEIDTDTISASTINTNDLIATDATVDTLTVVNTISGTITNATNAIKIGVNTTTTNASHFLTFVDNITGNLFPYVSSYLSFNPITQMLTSTNATINNELYVGDLVSTNGINGGSLSVSNGASVGSDLTLGGGITSPFMICNDAVNYTLTYSIIQYNECVNLNVYYT